MNKLLTAEEFRKISTYISENLGLYFAQDRQSDLERELAHVATDAGFGDLRSFVNSLLNSPPQKEQISLLATYLTIGETYFFRENRIFEILKHNIFNELLGKKEKIRIWSAGCCTGEEPYSIAMAVDEALPEIRKKDVTILATDINPEFLKKASVGIYSEWSFRSVSQEIKRKYFSRINGNKYKISPEIQQMVSFSYLNLIEDFYPSLLNETNAMDVIFCRNVLLYFNRDGIKRVTANFYNSLVEGGWLIPGMSELSHVTDPRLRSIHFQDAILYRKSTNEAEIAKSNPFDIKTSVNRNNGKGAKDLNVPERPAFSTGKRRLMSEQKSPERSSEAKPFSFRLAARLYSSGDYRAAAEQLEYLFGKGLLLKGEMGEAYVMISKSYANLGNIEKARLWCQNGLDANKLNSVLYLLLCNLLQEENKIDQAIEAAQKAIFIDPDYVMANFTLANIFRRQNHKREAVRYMNSALSILRRMGENETVRDSEGLSAARLKTIISSFLSENY